MQFIRKRLKSFENANRRIEFGKRKTGCQMLKRAGRNNYWKDRNLLLEPFIRNITNLDDDFLNFEPILQIALVEKPKRHDRPRFR